MAKTQTPAASRKSRTSKGTPARSRSRRSGANGTATRAGSTRAGSNGTATRAASNGTSNLSLRQLLRSGKESGQVEGKLVLEALPDHILQSAEKLVEVSALFGRHGISIKNWEPPIRMRKSDPRRRIKDDDYESYRSNDPVRVYLREMGAVSLLTREGEVEIAKRIEAGEVSISK